ncbi:hypothetical protein GA0070610_1729 [Micromonospora echinofusca]|uniref:Uncharacterized protein n=1 Tax=Micromonospora echinofusca TaxID=47858 RepID=A0A1C5G6G1_MICEH|nr:hypothetical protein [Micromonospora echinofusca]SCG15495.1 hypothetical protein GA0070610_1729 [Micromonospora echinofusca]
MSSEINVTYQVARSLPAAQQAAWRTLLAEFAAEIPVPEKVEVVITDEYDKVAGEYAVQEPDRMTQTMTADQYRAERADGARAAAKTRVLAEAGSSWWSTAQGWRSACRRSGTALCTRLSTCVSSSTATSPMRFIAGSSSSCPVVFTWEYVWFAENAIDEFRCERTVHERGWTSQSSLNTAVDFGFVVDVFERVRAKYRRTGDLMDTYHGAMPALLRMSTVLGYGAAGLATGVIRPADWVRAPAMGRFLDVLEVLPGTDRVLPGEEVAAATLELAKRLCQLFNEMGFDYREDEPGAFWLTVG